MLLDGTNVNFFIAFLAGVVAFFSPCVAPILPAYVGYLSGLAAQAPGQAPANPLRHTPFLRSLFFAVGFVIVFFVLGISAAGIGRIFIRQRELIERLGGILLMVLGLYVLDIFKAPWLYQQFRLDFHGKFSRNEKLQAFLVGLTFGFAWTPCIGPVLAVILFWASQAETIVRGAMLLLAFGIGLALPFLGVSLLLGTAMRWIRRSGRLLRAVQVVAGGIVLLVGVLMATGRFGDVLGYFIRITTPSL